MFKRILVPLDGSGLAERALPVAARLARASGGSITLVRVVSTAPASLPSAPARPNLVQMIDASDQLLASSYLEGVQAMDILKGIYVKTEIAVGLIAPLILSLAESSLSDIIVMSSHGFTGVTHWMMGSVAEKVASYANIPVLILRESIPSSESHDAGPHILVPLDGSQNAEAALQPAASLARALAGSGKASLYLMHVLTDDASTRENMARKYLNTIIQDGAAIPQDAALTLTASTVTNKDVARAIVDAAEHGFSGEETHFDVIALSTHGYGGLQRWATGSVTGRVLNTTRLPVLVVRPTELSS